MLSLSFGTKTTWAFAYMAFASIHTTPDESVPDYAIRNPTSPIQTRPKYQRGRKLTHNPQHEVYWRLKKSIAEKYGLWPEQAERLFKRLRALRKDLTDIQIMDIVRQEMKKHSKH